MNNFDGIHDIRIKIFNDDWNTISAKVNDFCAEHDGNVLDAQFQNGASGGVKVMVVYRDKGEEAG